MDGRGRDRLGDGPLAWGAGRVGGIGDESKLAGVLLERSFALTNHLRRNHSYILHTEFHVESY